MPSHHPPGISHIVNASNDALEHPSRKNTTLCGLLSRKVVPCFRSMDRPSIRQREREVSMNWSHLVKSSIVFKVFGGCV